MSSCLAQTVERSTANPSDVGSVSILVLFFINNILEPFLKKGLIIVRNRWSSHEAENPQWASWIWSFRAWAEKHHNHSSNLSWWFTELVAEKPISESITAVWTQNNQSLWRQVNCMQEYSRFCVRYSDKSSQCMLLINFYPRISLIWVGIIKTKKWLYRKKSFGLVLSVKNLFFAHFR